MEIFVIFAILAILGYAVAKTASVMPKAERSPDPPRFFKSAPHAPPIYWHTSSGGNAQIVIGDRRITVFEWSGGWKFCLARDDIDDDDPYFSEVYETEAAAKNEGIAMLGKASSKYKTRWEVRQDKLSDLYSATLSKADDGISALERVVNSAVDDDEINITKLRPVERKLNQQYAMLRSAYVHFAADDQDGKANSAMASMKRVEAMQTTVKEKIAWLRDTPKNLR